MRLLLLPAALVALCAGACVLGASISELPARVNPQPEAHVVREVCYGDLGCFNTGGHFFDILRRPINFLPQSPERINVKFALYRRNHVLTPQFLVHGDEGSLARSSFDGKKDTKLIIHGFIDGGDELWMRDMKKAYLIRGDFNVIQVDWSGGNGLPYTQATSNTRVVGAVIAKMIRWLEAQTGTSREQFHLAGHSLGSHISGYAGERLREGHLQLGRITALDPAGPYFENMHETVRIDPTDARFVDAIHTDGDSLVNSVKLKGGLGMMQAVGHVDFYPNGGKKQPDCTRNPIINIIINGIVEGTKWTVACYHLRVNPLYTNTILHGSGDYQAYPCDSYEDFQAGQCLSCGAGGCASLGLRASEWKPAGRTNVKMFLDTTGKEPFETHHYLMRISISSPDVSSKKQYGDLFLTFKSGAGHVSSEVRFAEKTYLEAGKTYEFLGTNPEPDFDIEEVRFRWKHRWILAIFTQKLYVSKIEVLHGRKQRTSLFCANDSEIASNSGLNMASSNSC